MGKYNPIGLYGAGEGQRHDGYGLGDTTAARYQDIVGYVSAKAGNAIRLGSDGLLYANNLMKGTSEAHPTEASDPFAVGYPKPSSPLFPKTPEDPPQLSDTYKPYRGYNIQGRRTPAERRHEPVISYNAMHGHQANAQILDRVIDVRDLISHDRGNALRIGDDGRLYIYNNCGGVRP